MGMGHAPFYVDPTSDHDDCGASMAGLHRLKGDETSYCGSSGVVEADGVETEMTGSVCLECEDAFREAHPRAFIPPGNSHGLHGIGTSMRRCQSRHRKCWVIGPGWLWCYECGAVRLNTKPGEDRWTYPVGPDGENPAVRRTK